MASGRSLQVIGEIALKFRIRDFEFEENFRILPTTNSIFSGSPFFTKHHVGIFPAEKLWKFPEMTLQVNEINEKGYRRRFRSTVKFSAKTIRQVTTKPNSQEVLFLTIGNKMHNCRGMTGMLLPKVEWQEKINLWLSSCLTTINHKNEVDMLALNLTPNIVIVAENQEIANFKVLSGDEAESFIPIPPEMIILGKAIKGVLNQINQLLQFQEKKELRQLKKPKPNHNSLWFPTPET